MTPSRIAVLACFVVLLVVPLVMRPGGGDAPAGARRLIIITPHNEQIRREFAPAFDRWHFERFGEHVEVIFSSPGGTSEIRKMLQAQFEAALRDGRPVGGSADLVFGGGTYEHDVLKQGVTVKVGGEERSTSISAPVPFADDWLEDVYGPNQIGDGMLYDPEKHWFGTAVSGFGIVYNRDVLRDLGVGDPMYWDDLCHPLLAGWLALVNPGQSGSVTTAFDAILQRRGWIEGWQILRRAGASSRYFSGTSLKPPIDVSRGDAAMGVCIDFYGRFQSQVVADAGDPDRLGYVDPPGETVIDADPISMLRNPPDRELAQRFIAFCLTEKAQSLWQFRAGASDSDGLGPRVFELRRMPVLRSMYENHFDRFVDQVNPFEIARPVAAPNSNIRSFIAILFAAMVMDNHEKLAEAWQAIIEHPAYPDHGELVTAGDVDDPTLREMLELFDSFPEVRGPGGLTLSLGAASNLADIKAGWLGGGWSDEGLWNRHARPDDALRRECADFYRERYEQIVKLGE